MVRQVQRPCPQAKCIIWFSLTIHQDFDIFIDYTRLIVMTSHERLCTVGYMWHIVNVWTYTLWIYFGLALTLNVIQGRRSWSQAKGLIRFAIGIILQTTVSMGPFICHLTLRTVNSFPACKAVTCIAAISIVYTRSSILTRVWVTGIRYSWNNKIRLKV